jgi:hypothetical protein
MDLLLLQSPLQNFSELVLGYFIEIWDFLIFVGGLSGVLIVLAGVIIWLTHAHIPRGRGLILGGIILCIVIEYFILFPPDFVTP